MLPAVIAKPGAERSATCAPTNSQVAISVLRDSQARPRVPFVKRRELLKAIAAAARDSELSWVLARQGANHEVYSLDGLIIPVPRHTEINELTAESIFKECEPKLGRRWWK